MAAPLRARAGSDDARAAASISLARFAYTSPFERVRVFPFGDVLTVCKFRLGQPAVTVYKVRLSKCAAPVQQGIHKFTFQSTLHFKSGLREIVRANDAFLALTAQGVWTVPLGEVR